MKWFGLTCLFFLSGAVGTGYLLWPDLEFRPSQAVVDTNVDTNDNEIFEKPLHGVNYYPQRTPWSLFWQSYDPDTVSQDLQTIKALGFNTVRIFLPYPVFASEQSTDAGAARTSARNFLQQAQTHQLQCVLTLFDFYQDYEQPALAQKHLRELVPALRAEPALFAWDLKNELDRDIGHGKAILEQWIAQNVALLKTLDPDHPVTIGWSQPEAIAEFMAPVDYDTFHYYGRPEAFAKRLGPVKQQRKTRGTDQRPLVMGEFGYHTWPENPVDPHFVEHQYNYLNAMLSHRLSSKLSGSMVWNLYDYPTTLREDWVLQQHSFQYHMGLLDATGQQKPGIQALQQHVFVRDARTGGEVTLKTEALMLVFETTEAGQATLLDTSGKVLRQWRVSSGLQTLRYAVTAKEIEDLVYLRKRYQLKTPAGYDLSGKIVPAGVQKLVLRLR